jgi:hypothetical protein
MHIRQTAYMGLFIMLYNHCSALAGYTHSATNFGGRYPHSAKDRVYAWFAPEQRELLDHMVAHLKRVIQEEVNDNNNTVEKSTSQNTPLKPLTIHETEKVVNNPVEVSDQQESMKKRLAKGKEKMLVEKKSEIEMVEKKETKYKPINPPPLAVNTLVEELFAVVFHDDLRDRDLPSDLGYSIRYRIEVCITTSKSILIL